MDVDNYKKSKEDIDNIRDKIDLLLGIPKFYVTNIVNEFDTNVIKLLSK